jgi:hypothetical protein
MIADHTPTTPRKIEVIGDKPVFALHYGSIVGSIVKLPFRPTIFVVGLVAGGGATTAARVNGLVKRPRQGATHTQPNKPLQDIRETCAGGTY